MAIHTGYKKLTLNDKINIKVFDDIGIVENGNHYKIYNDDDLLAIVFNETDISSSGNGFLI